MPLHLLGKKSWNVYNHDNVERVRRDEAEAEAREAAEEQRMQQEDALHRISILRGDAKPIRNRVEQDDAQTKAEVDLETRDALREPSRKRRRLRGEDDTDKEIRWAQEDARTGEEAKTRLHKHQRGNETPLHDHHGHIQLVTEKQSDKAGVKPRKVEDEQGMRFADAAGYKNDGRKPWYATKTSNPEESLSMLPEKNVWGDEDPRRRQREQVRVSSNDPFAFMKQAQSQLKKSEQDREKWNQQQQAEIQSLKRDKRRRHHRDIPSLSLDRSSSSHRRHHRHRRRDEK